METYNDLVETLRAQDKKIYEQQLRINALNFENEQRREIINKRNYTIKQQKKEISYQKARVTALKRYGQDLVTGESLSEVSGGDKV